MYIKIFLQITAFPKILETVKNSKNSETVKIFSQILTVMQTCENVLKNSKIYKNGENIFPNSKIYGNGEIIFANSKIFENGENI